MDGCRMRLYIHTPPCSASIPSQKCKPIPNKPLPRKLVSYPLLEATYNTLYISYITTGVCTVYTPLDRRSEIAIGWLAS